MKKNSHSNYEIIYILDVKAIDKDKTKAKIIDFLDGKNVKFEDLGVKNFAYPINKMFKGHYFLYKALVEKTKIAKFIPKVTTWKDIIRSLVINLDEEKTFKYSKEYVQKLQEIAEQKKQELEEDSIIPGKG